MRIRIIALGWLVVAGGFGVAIASHIPGQRIVARQTIDLLPAVLQAYYAPDVDAVIEHAIEPDGAWRRQRRTTNRDDWHYLKLDVAATDNRSESRIRAARDFPRSRTDAKNVFAAAGIDDGGRLPWSLDRLATRLTRAFRDQDRDQILELTGQVIHFCADAGFAFRCTKDDRGDPARNLVLTVAEMGEPLFAHQNVSYRVGWELIRRNAHRYRTALKQEAGSAVAVDDVRDACFETMIRSLADLEPICVADAEIIARMHITGEAAFRARSEEYYQLLDGQCGQLCVQSLRRGSELAAGVITYAWKKSGGDDLTGEDQVADAKGRKRTSGSRPTDPDRRAGSSTRSSSKDASSQGASSKGGATKGVSSAGGFVASRHSKVYHRPDCPHALQIKDRNLRRFKTEQDAIDSGRRRCHTCFRDSGG